MSQNNQANQCVMCGAADGIYSLRHLHDPSSIIWVCNGNTTSRPTSSCTRDFYTLSAAAQYLVPDIMDWSDEDG